MVKVVEEEAMTTAIIGIGKTGNALARHLVRGGEQVVLVLHVLKDVGVPPLRVIARSEWPSLPFAPIRDPVGVNRGIKSPADPRKHFIYGPEGLGRPVSRILL